MSMRDWLIVVVIVGIILILIDGYRRKRKNTIRMKLDKNIPSAGVKEIDEAAAELPNGGARVVSRDGNDVYDEDDEYDDDGNEEYYGGAYGGAYESAYESADESADEDEEENVPVLMDAVELGDRARDNTEADPDDGKVYDDEDMEYQNGDEADIAEQDEEDFDEEDDWDDEDESGGDPAVASDDFDDEEVSPVRVSRRNEQNRQAPSEDRSTGRIEPSLGEFEHFSEEELDDKPARLKEKKSKTPDSSKEQVQAELFSESPADFYPDEEEQGEQYQEPEEVIVINVMAKNGEHFAGSELLPVLLQQGMQLGGMSIFHKHADSEGNGPVMFSMANMVKPGTFDLALMDQFSTPGVSFFLQLPNSLGNMKCFEQMLNAANAVKQTLNGDLKDENRSVITRQTIEHCRQRIQDFELAQLAKK